MTLNHSPHRDNGGLLRAISGHCFVNGFVYLKSTVRFHRFWIHWVSSAGGMDLSLVKCSVRALVPWPPEIPGLCPGSTFSRRRAELEPIKHKHKMSLAIEAKSDNRWLPLRPLDLSKQREDSNLICKEAGAALQYLYLLQSSAFTEQIKWNWLNINYLDGLVPLTKLSRRCLRQVMGWSSLFFSNKKTNVFLLLPKFKTVLVTISIKD